jgi:hypothetical protein
MPSAFIGHHTPKRAIMKSLIYAKQYVKPYVLCTSIFGATVNLKGVIECSQYENRGHYVEDVVGAVMVGACTGPLVTPLVVICMPWILKECWEEWNE